MSGLDAAVVVATRDRPLRLRWLLNALAEQLASGPRFQVLVAFDPVSYETTRLLESHPLRAAGRLETVAFPPGSTFPGAGRNAAWRATDAPLILFTDDDCRPAADWVQRTVAAGRAHPGAIVQGRTLPDPDEMATLTGAPWSLTMNVSPPTPWAQTCNIAYPRSVLEALGGFAEGMRVGEDADLALRARARGIPFVADPEMLVYHAVQELRLARMLQAQTRWRDLALLVKRQPEVRRHFWGRIWWKPEHAALFAAVAGSAVASRCRPAAALALPWLALSLRHRGYGPRGLARSVAELPGRAAIDATEIGTLVRGSIRYRTLVL